MNVNPHIFNSCELLDDLEYKWQKFSNNYELEYDKVLCDFFTLEWFVQKFYTNSNEMIVVILNCAPGIEIYSLALMYPHVIFHLHDVHQFINKIKSLPNVVIFENIDKFFNLYEKNYQKYIIYSKLENFSNNGSLQDKIKEQNYIVARLNPECAFLNYILSKHNCMMPLGINIVQPFSKYNEIGIVQFKNTYFIKTCKKKNIRYKQKIIKNYYERRVRNSFLDINILRKMFDLDENKIREKINFLKNQFNICCMV